MFLRYKLISTAIMSDSKLARERNKTVLDDILSLKKCWKVGLQGQSWKCNFGHKELKKIKNTLFVHNFKHWKWLLICSILNIWKNAHQLHNTKWRLWKNLELSQYGVIVNGLFGGRMEIKSYLWNQRFSFTFLPFVNGIVIPLRFFILKLRLFLWSKQTISSFN